MGTRTISISDEAYERLKAEKNEKDSFSDVIVKLTRKGKLSNFAGILTEKEASNLEKKIRDSRKSSRERMETVRREMRK